MNLYDVQFNPNDAEENEGFLVYAKNKRQALVMAYNACQSPPDRDEIAEYSKIKECEFSDELIPILTDKDRSFVLNPSNHKFAYIYRKNGWRQEYEMSCLICGLYPFGISEYELNEDCICKECVK